MMTCAVPTVLFQAAGIWALACLVVASMKRGVPQVVNRGGFRHLEIITEYVHILHHLSLTESRIIDFASASSRFAFGRVDFLSRHVCFIAFFPPILLIRLAS